MPATLPAPEKPLGEFHRLLLRTIVTFLANGGDKNEIAPALQRELDEHDEEAADL